MIGARVDLQRFDGADRLAKEVRLALGLGRDTRGLALTPFAFARLALERVAQRREVRQTMEARTPAP